MKSLIILLLACCSVFAANYSTSFPTVETPISESGKWYNMMATSQDWSNMCVVVSGRAQGKNGHDTSDSTAILTGTWGGDQDCSGVVVRDSNLGATNFPELELHVNMTPTAHNITGYEALYSMSVAIENNFMARWDGAPGAFVNLGDMGATAALNGNTVRFFRNGATLTMQISGVTIGNTVDDSTYQAGAPGIGADANDTNYDYSKFGFSSFTATDGLNSKITLGVAGSKLGAHKL